MLRAIAGLVALATLTSFGGLARAQVNFTLDDNLLNLIDSNGIFGFTDADASHAISVLNETNSFIRNGLNGASFDYRVVGQASADSTFGSPADGARVFGNVELRFDLPAVALWNIRVDTSYRGVTVSESGATASIAPLTISGTGAASSLLSVTNPSFGFQTTQVQNRLPGTASVRAAIDLSATSNSGEGLASIGQTSHLSPFSSNSAVNTASQGAFVTVTLLPHLNFSGQTLNSTGIVTQSGENITGFGTITGGVTTAAGSSVAVDPGRTLDLGNQVELNGPTVVGTNGNLVLRDNDTSFLNGMTTLQGGRITAIGPGGIAVNGTLQGSGIVQGQIGGNGIIRAQGGALTLGDASRPNSWAFGGTLDIGSRDVTLLSGNTAVMNHTTILNGGALHAPGGVLLTGTIQGPGLVAADLVNQGVIDGRGTLELSGRVSGTGSFLGAIALSGTFAPGNSPGLVTFGGSATLTASSLTEMELGGLIPGVGHDKVVVTGVLTLDGGELDVLYWDGFVAGAGDVFDLFDWGTLVGTFEEVHLPTLAAGLSWDLSRLYLDGSISVSAPIPEPQTYAMMLAGLALLGFRARRRSKLRI